MKKFFGKEEETEMESIYNKGLYGVYDKQVDVYGSFHVCRNKGEALRSFMMAANDEKHPIGKFPQHFYLVEMGRISETTGKVIGHEVPEVVGHALELQQAKPLIPQAAQVGSLRASGSPADSTLSDGTQLN